MMKTKENSMYNYLSIEQIRSALDFLENSYSKAMDGDAYGLANAILTKIEGLKETLVAKITAEDPCTTAADVRYFEGWNY
jgi:hypothetical protein